VLRAFHCAPNYLRTKIRTLNFRAKETMLFRIENTHVAYSSIVTSVSSNASGETIAAQFEHSNSKTNHGMKGSSRVSHKSNGRKSNSLGIMKPQRSFKSNMCKLYPDVFGRVTWLLVHRLPPLFLPHRVSFFSSPFSKSDFIYSFLHVLLLLLGPADNKHA